MVQNLKWGTAHLSRRLGAGARRRGSWARGRVAGAGRAWACGRALQAAGRAGARRSGRAELVGARQTERAQAERATGWASGSRRAGRLAGRPVRT